MQRTPRLRELRERAALSQEDIAERSGVARATIADLEAGKRPARPSTIRKLAKGLNVDVTELYSESESPKVPAPPSPEQPPLNGFDKERRGPSLHGWTALVNLLADRWEQEITERENEWQAAKPAVKKFVKRLPNLSWGAEIRTTAADVWAAASDELEAGLSVYTSEEAFALFTALKRLDSVIDRTDNWYSRAVQSVPEGGTVHDISEGAERAAERKAALERTGRRLGA